MVLRGHLHLRLVLTIVILIVRATEIIFPDMNRNREIAKTGTELIFEAPPHNYTDVKVSFIDGVDLWSGNKKYKVLLTLLKH